MSAIIQRTDIIHIYPRADARQIWIVSRHLVRVPRNHII